MVALLPSPVSQFSDANGLPYAGGSIQTLVPGTTTPKTTWSESTGTIANTNPIILNSAGECTIYADGAVRMILTDASSNLIFDQPSNTLVSAAMAPVCIAPDIATAQSLLGIISSSAGLTTLTTGLAAEVTARTAETTRATAAEAVLTTAVAADNTAIAALTASVAAISTTHKIQSGTGGPTNALTGHARVTFTPAYAACSSFVAQALQSGLGGTGQVAMSVNFDNTGADVWSFNSFSGVFISTDFTWIAVGS